MEGGEDFCLVDFMNKSTSQSRLEEWKEENGEMSEQVEEFLLVLTEEESKDKEGRKKKYKGETKKGRKKNKTNNRKQEKKEKVQIECPICYMETENVRKLSSCGHEYCSECIGHYLNDFIRTANVESIPCPNPSCRLPLTEDDVRSGVSSESLLDKYIYFRQVEEWKKDPNARWCPWCDHVCSIEDTGVINIECEKCMKMFCYSCKVRWHEGLTCDQFAKSNHAIDKKMLKWKKKHKVKECPSCGLLTSKIGGCPDVFCVGCHQRWEWHYNDPDWCSDGFYKKSETKIEKVAFFYPRLLKMSIGSHEIREEEYRLQIILLMTLLGLGGVPATLILGLPALGVRTYRKVKRKFKSNG